MENETRPEELLSEWRQCQNARTQGERSGSAMRKFSGAKSLTLRTLFVLSVALRPAFIVVSNQTYSSKPSGLSAVLG
jgi:hypothetical protein